MLVKLYNKCARLGRLIIPETLWAFLPLAYFIIDGDSRPGQLNTLSGARQGSHE